MKYEVLLISDAEEDLVDIYQYVVRNDSILEAESLLNILEQTCLSLSAMPKRGHAPPELEQIGVYDYREIHYKPYRILYQVVTNRAFIHCILDGRRDLGELLQKRLLR